MKISIRILSIVCFFLYCVIAVNGNAQYYEANSGQDQSFEFDSLETFQFGTYGGTDCWGYTAPNKVEYAIMGTLEGVVFVNTSNMIIAGKVVGPNNNCSAYWRDIKTYENYCYIVSECKGTNEGLMIVDMKYLPDSVHYVGSIPIYDDSGVVLTTSHNFSIDTAKGFAYVEGFFPNYGLGIFDLQNPESPLLIGKIETFERVHDVYAFNDTVYIAEVGFAIWDCTDKSNPNWLVDLTFPSGFNHNIWPTPDRNFMVTTEEAVGQTVKIWDIKNLDSITLVSEYLGGSQQAHNAQVEGDHLFISHYKSGVKVLDISNPSIPIEVGSLDTWPQSETPYFNGCWGVYPHTQNGMVFASNTDGKLFIIQSSLNSKYPIVQKFNMGADNANNVISETPTFYWTFRDTIGSQSGFQLEIGTDEEWSVPEMWSTGEVFASDTSITYSGASLIRGESYPLRIRVHNGSKWGDWTESNIRMNVTPPVPELIFPINWEEAVVHATKLRVDYVIDEESEYISYEFKLYSDRQLLNLVDQSANLSKDSIMVESESFSGLIPGESYYWTCQANDGFEYSSIIDTGYFVGRANCSFSVPSDYATIQNAIDSIGYGDTALVAPGTYYENIVIERNIHLVSADGPETTYLNPEDSTILFVIIKNIDQFATVSGFTLKESFRIGHFTIFSSQNVDISNNIFKDTGGSLSKSIYFYLNSSGNIHNNLFANNNNGSAIRISSDYVNVYNNTFYNNRSSIISDSEETRIWNNIISNSYSYGLLGYFKSVDYNNIIDSKIQFADDMTVGPNNISVDPAFTDTANSDFTLSALSPCIDAGDPASEFNDADGSRSDMGAYPFVMVTDINDKDEALPYKFLLGKNYPNPFNPSTTIEFSLAKISIVRLSIYNINGRLVVDLIDHEEISAGKYEISWDGITSSGNRASTGLYFYRLSAGEYVDTKKMLLLK